MRIIGDLTTPMNSRHNRAAWLTPPFDLSTSTLIRLSLSGTKVANVPLYGAVSGRYSRFAAEIDNLLVESPTGDFLEIFSTFSPTNNNSVYNTSCWAAPSKVNFTGRAWYGEDSNEVPLGATNQAATLVTPRHAMVAEHSNWHSGVATPWTLTWIASDGTAHERTILGKSGQVAGTDIQILYLDEPDLPSTIAKYKVLPADYGNYLSYMGPGLTLNLGPDYEVRIRHPAIATCQHQRAHVAEVYGVDEWATDKWRIAIATFIGSASSEPWRMSGNRNAYSTYEHGTVPTAGDSGHPVFMLLGGEMVLLGCWINLYCPFVARHIDAINAAMLTLEAAYGGSDGYQLQEWTPPTTPDMQFEIAGTDDSNQVLVGA